MTRKIKALPGASAKLPIIPCRMLSISFLARYVVEKAVFAISGSPEKDQTRVKYKSVFPGEVRYFVQTCMMQVGAKEEHAASLAELLVSADTRGHYSHGLNRLGECKHLMVEVKVVI